MARRVRSYSTASIGLNLRGGRWSELHRHGLLVNGRLARKRYRYCRCFLIRSVRVFKHQPSGYLRILLGIKHPSCYTQAQYKGPHCAVGRLAKRRTPSRRAVGSVAPGHALQR